MAYKVFDDLNYNEGSQSTNVHKIILDSDSGQRVELPDSSYVSDANITRSGADLILETSDGTVIVEGYFSAATPPNLTAPDGTTLTADLVNSFIRGGDKYAETSTQTDVSPVGAVQEIAGEATVTRVDGTVEVVGIGTPIYQGDVVETDENGAVNIMFIDQTTFAVSEDARLAIDEYVFDPATQTGTTNFSVLKGVFVFTSGLIGREDPDDVMINTPSGSIGIRGTIIAGDVDEGEITVIEGAIVLHDLAGNTMTLSTQFETAKFNLSDSTIEHMGELAANDVSSKFMSVSTVAADLFSSIEDAANDDTTSSSDDSDDGSSASSEDSEDTEASGEQSQDSENTEQNDEEASAEEVITTDDIIEASEDDQTETTEPSEPSSDSQETASDSGQTDTADTAPSQPFDQADPPFSVSVTRLPFTENTNGSNVAIVHGNFTDVTNLTLLGTSVNYYEINRIDDNTLIISLKPGVSIDHEDEYPLFFSASNESDNLTVVQQINPLSLNQDEPVTYDAVAPNVSGVDNYFSGSDDTVLTYDLNQEFQDEEGITGLSLVGTPSHADLSSLTLVDGILTVQLNSGVSDGSFTFTIQADTATEFVQETFTFDIHAATTGSSTIISTNAVYSGNDTNITVAANNVSVFSDIDNSTNYILISGDDAYVKSGGGDDEITVNAGSNNYHIYADAGDDIIHHNDVLGKAYGGDGDDKFVIKNNTAQGNLESYTTAASKIDGGDGVDTLHFNSSTSGNINLSNVDNGLITNIEILDFDNGTGHVIDIHYDDVINMTDDSNTLIIDLDANDTLSFNNTSPNTFFQAPGTVEVDSQTYNVFTDGTVTLLVDVESTNVSGIV
ncbi:MAG: FecR domain-containing protein [Alcanivorax sp.]